MTAVHPLRCPTPARHCAHVLHPLLLAASLSRLSGRASYSQPPGQPLADCIHWMGCKPPHSTPQTQHASLQPCSPYPVLFQGIQHGRLPIGEYMKLASSQVCSLGGRGEDWCPRSLGGRGED